MTEADSDEDCDRDGWLDFVFDLVDTDDEDENAVDELQQDLEPSVLPNPLIGNRFSFLAGGR